MDAIEKNNAANGEIALIKNTVLSKEVWRNDAISNVINSTICEYDIKGAHLVAIHILFGDELYNKLAVMDKLSRNIYIGNMVKKDPDLSIKLQKLLFKFKQKFIEENNIFINNIIETTKDSLVLVQKIPTTTTVKVNGVDVEFRNKDGIYSSFYKLGSKSILFDSMTGNLRIKGINMQTVQESEFVNLYLKELLTTLETSISLGNIECMKILKQMRQKYINASDNSIYKSLNDKNKFIYEVAGEMIETDVEINNPAAKLMKIMNYRDFVMPLMRSII